MIKLIRPPPATTAVLVLSLGLCLPSLASENGPLMWERLPDLPPSSRGQAHPGLAGPFVGVHYDALIVAGGASESHEGGPLAFHDDIYVLRREADGS
jgi:N-acetylneuraminic acid mutarotase